MTLKNATIPALAASLILIRYHAGQGIKILMGRRSRNLRFMPGYLVFPGGRAEEEDRPLGLLRTALRECVEETGWALKSGEQSAAQAVMVGRAITPESSPIRFDTHFFLMDAGLFEQSCIPDGELEDVGWYLADAQDGPLELADVTRFMMREALQCWRAPVEMLHRRKTPLVTYGPSGLEYRLLDADNPITHLT